jgi:hypothetical protein
MITKKAEDGRVVNLDSQCRQELPAFSDNPLAEVVCKKSDGWSHRMIL